MITNILEYNGKLRYIPTGNACFRKCIENTYKRDFPDEYKEFILDSDRCKNIATLARVQLFCKRYNFNIGVYILNSKRILPQTVKEENICSYLYKNLFCVFWKTNRENSLFDAVKETENSFKYEETQIGEDIIKDAIEYKFLISKDKNCLYSVFAFDHETCNAEYSEYCKAFASGVYHLSIIYGCFNADLIKELAIEMSKVLLLDRENRNPVLEMIDSVINNYKGQSKDIFN